MHITTLTCSRCAIIVLNVKVKTICVHNMFSPCSELEIFMYCSGNSMNNLLSYCGLIDAEIRVSDIDLHVYVSL